ncbi:WD40 domain containing protein [Asbolus verrucosus]|uniref:WD40 domain containing protein n=1 Tax=Asbolus verrucosus TaxID=1661398 RepID=A0A482VM00_ASBVE|nr:WD40 domain containing protein [Asbolus verrucosus]
MSSAKKLFEQQYGVARWKCYDSIIGRLRCPKEEQYVQLLPAEDVLLDTPIFACKFAQQKNNETLLALANEDGKLAIHDTTNREQRYGVRAHNNAIFDLAWMFEDMKIVTASGDHTARLFDVCNSDIREIKAFYGHSRSVKTIAFRKDDPSVFATGGRDGNIIVWDTRTDVGSFIGKADRTIFNSHNTKTTPSKTRKKCVCLSPSTASSAKSVTGLVFQDDNTLISCGAGDGIIKIWDLRKNYLFYKHEPIPKNKIPYAGSTTKNGFSSLIIDKDCMKLYANCLDSTIYSYNLSTCNPVPIMKYVGHQNSTFYIKSSLSRDGSYLISGSSDENAYIWNTNCSHPLVKLTGHNAEVTCVAWCERDDITLVTCSDDMSHKIWRVGPEDLPENWEIIGKGKAEILPLVDTQSKLKRIGEQITEVSKKLIVSCKRCENASTSAFCQNCCSSKRKQLEEIGNENKRFHTEMGPRRLFHNLTGNSKQAPTINLPNYVLNGVAPHLNFSPPKRKDQDWLTKIRIERKFRRDILDTASTSSPPKVPKLELTPKRSSSPQSPILRFFKVKCEGHSCSNKATTGSNVLISSPQSSQ